MVIQAEKYSPFITISRKEWAKWDGDTAFFLSDEELDRLHALNEPLTMEEVKSVYLPLARLLNQYVSAQQELHRSLNRFLDVQVVKTPYVIGIAGSVAAGKSTAARVLQRLLSAWPQHREVALVTTDGFLLPNKVLEEKGLMNRKGFPESYDTRRLIKFLADIKSGRGRVAVPLYSHLEYDVLQGEQQWVNHPDIVIVEGINVLQVRPQQSQKEPALFVSDFFDFSIYVHAEEEHLQQWFLERFEWLRRTAFRNPRSYFYRYAAMDKVEAMAFARQIWNEINRPNLVQNILPTRYRASLVLEKGSGHFVQKILLRKV